MGPRTPQFKVLKRPQSAPTIQHLGQTAPSPCLDSPQSELQASTDRLWRQALSSLTSTQQTGPFPSSYDPMIPPNPHHPPRTSFLALLCQDSGSRWWVLPSHEGVQAPPLPHTAASTWLPFRLRSHAIRWPSMPSCSRDWCSSVTGRVISPRRFLTSSWNRTQADRLGQHSTRES